MFLRGINYDVGIEFSSYQYLSRRTFDVDVVRRELAIIRDDLHCDAVRISGTNPTRLRDATVIAVELGLTTWVSPHLHDTDPAATRDYMVECATLIAELANRTPSMVFVVGSELTLFMRGILPGANLQRRLLGNPLGLPRLKWSSAPAERLNAWLHDAVAQVREVFPGPVAYAAAPIERVDWTPLDYVSLDYYRGRRNRDNYAARLQRHFAFGKPVYITELGLCTYRGAEAAGGRGWNITTMRNGRLQIKGNRCRDEGLQARELVDMLLQVETAGVAGAFVYTFVAPELTHDGDPRFDLDMASYSVVKSYPTGHGRTYPDLCWDPKQAFAAVAQHYRQLDSGSSQ